MLASDNPLDTPLIDTIIDKIRTTISELPDGVILTSAEAFKFTEEIVTQNAVNNGVDTTTAEFRRHARDVYYQSYSTARQLVAAQLIGITFQEAIETTEKAVLRFLDRSELEIVPRPTLAYTGECEPHDIWNLLSNSFSAMKTAEQKKALLSGDDLFLLKALRRSEQLLLMISQRDVLPEDVDGKPYDGKIHEQAWVRNFKVSS
jgi:hypothetical protein